MRRIFVVMLFATSIFCLSGCGPTIKSQEDQEVIKSDSLNPQEGKGEGPVPDEVIR